MKRLQLHAKIWMNLNNKMLGKKRAAKWIYSIDPLLSVKLNDFFYAVRLKRATDKYKNQNSKEAEKRMVFIQK